MVVHTAHEESGIGEGDSFALGCQSAEAEARSLLPLLLAGSTVEAVLELIAVPPRIEYVLLWFARTHAEEAHFIERSLKFGQSVAREFERLVRDGVPDGELPQMEETELDIT